MPWEVKQEGMKYCVFKSDTGAKLRCYPNRTQAEEYIAALYANTDEKMETLSNVMLEEGGPVITGVAVTNIPHLPLPPMSVVEKDGQKLIRVPFLRKGIFRHPNGNLIFNDNVFDKMLENHRSKRSHYGVSLNLRHDPKFGALAWFDDERGGTVVKENDPEFGDLLVGYGKPTTDKALELVENKQYVFASVEFNPKHKSNLIQKLSADDLEEINKDELVDALEDIAMDEVTISLEEYDALKAKAETVEELQAKVAEAEQKIKTLETVVVDEDEQMSEKTKLMLEEQRKEIQRLKAKALQQDVDLVISKAENYRDSNGRGHSPVLLEIVRDAMLGKAIQVKEDETIKLESNTGSDVAEYLRKVLVHVLNTIPGQVQFETKTEGNDEISVFEEMPSFTNDELKAFWAESV